MRIETLNPIGYQAKTEKGNTYQKSNIATSIGLVSAAAIDLSPKIWKNNIVAKLLSTANDTLFDLLKTFNKNISPKLKTPLNIFGYVIDIAFAYGIGRYIDNKINTNRAQKADLKAEA